MIHPRIMLPPSDSAIRSSGTTAKIGYIEPNHWGGDFTASTTVINAGAVKYSDQIILAGYTNFQLWCPFGTVAGADSLMFYFQLWSRSANTYITLHTNSTVPGNAELRHLVLGEVLENESHYGPLSFGSDFVLAGQGASVVVDVVRLVISNEGVAAKTVYNSNMHMFCR